jgi:2-polyprenyl-6-methoxyphenol hydroxylase-like FAD-dependent oxidoreductase
VRALDIGIVGYGTAGQAAALFLSRAGHRLRIFERAPKLGPVGAGILLQPTGLAVLADLGLLAPALECGARVERLVGHNLAGRSIMDMRYAQLDPTWFGLGIQRGTLFELLRQAYAGAGAVTTGSEIVALDAERGTFVDAAGQRHGPFDLLVVADGAASKLRAGNVQVRRDQPYPWGALWCLCADPQRRFDGQLWQRYDRARRMAGVLPVGHLPGEEAGQHRVSFFWSLPMAGVDAWRQGGVDAWKAQVHAYWPEAADLLIHVQSAEQLARASYRDVILNRPWRGRAVWIGDAAHAMSPQLGQGANLALLDAQVLAAALERGASPDLALRAYARERRQHVHIYQFISRWLTPLFQSEHDVAAKLRDLAFGPLGRMPIARGQMLKVLSGTKRGWLGTLHLQRERSPQWRGVQDSGGT